MNRQKTAVPGDVVLSCAGRDAGRIFAVVWAQGDMLGLCDGDLHKAAHIKKKKKKHIQQTGQQITLPSAYDDNRDGTFDAAVRKALRRIQKQGR